MNILRSGPTIPLLLFVFSCALYAINLNKAPDFDELYHILAAHGYLKTGAFSIADGLYQRGRVFTWLVAKLFSVFGEHRWVARLPSVVSVALMASLLFVWLRARTGNLAALLAALLFAVSPFAVDTAQFARFYGVHAFAFLAACFAIYAAVVEQEAWTRRIGFAVVGMLALAVAMYFQVTTLIGIVGLGVWGGLYVVVPWLLRRDVTVARKRALVVGGIALMLIVLVVGLATGKLQAAFVMFRNTPMWAAENAGNVVFYHTWFVLFYPTLWTLLPMLTVIALVAAPRPVFFAMVIFGVGILLHSLAGNKSLRYVFYLMPFIFTIWGVALATVLRRTISFMRRHATAAITYALPGRAAAGGLAAVVVALGVVWLLVANAATIRTVTLLADITVPPAQPAPRWDVVRQVLHDELENSDVILTSTELDAIYYLGDYDVLISKSRYGEVLSQGMGKQEFDLDRRTGRPVIASPEAVEKVIRCYPTGLLITPAFRWRRGPMIDDEVADLVVREMEPVELPKGTHLLAFRWSHPALGAAQDCPVIAHSRAASTSAETR